MSSLKTENALLFFLASGHYPVEGRTLSDIVLAHSSGRRRLVDVRPDLPEYFVQVGAIPGTYSESGELQWQVLLLINLRTLAWGR